MIVSWACVGLSKQRSNGMGQALPALNDGQLRQPSSASRLAMEKYSMESGALKRSYAERVLKRDRDVLAVLMAQA